RSFLNHLRNHNDYSASSILSFALSSTSYRQLPPMGVFERINGLGHRANLHSASQRNFALSGISASYRADFLKLRFPKISAG
ncbi:hypothetical protein P2N75_26915, partial [Escherichia coli]